MNPEMGENRFKVHFMPDNLEILVAQGSTLLEAARQAGVSLNASCGGEGHCGKCKVKIVRGSADVDQKSRHQITEAEFKEGFRLACQSRVNSDIEVSLPADNSQAKAVLPPRLAKLAGKTLARWRLRPPLKKYYLEIQPPTLEDNASDLFRLMRALELTHNLKNIPVSFEVIRQLANVLRAGNWKATATTLVEPARPRTKIRNTSSIIHIQIGDTRPKNYALAIDIGTTTVCSQVLDLNSGQIMAETLVFNRQRTFGDDVISRIVHSQKPDGRQQLQQAVVTSINESLDKMLADSKIERQDVGHVTVAGNTTMEMLLLGLDPQYIRLSPYTTTANFLPPVKAASLGIKLAEQVNVFLFPCVSSYIGGDIVAGVIAAGIHQSRDINLFMDLGTNGEIVMGNAEWMVTASCSAGPAFEGGGIKFGMVARESAIQDFSVDRDSLEPSFTTIGNLPPAGICGSGLVNAIAEMLAAGIIDRNGKFKTGLNCSRLRQGAEGFEYILARASETGIGQDIVITEVDIKNLVMAKAAMFAGCCTLAKQVNIKLEEIDRVILAGNFGNSLDIENAIVLGLLPDLPRDRFVFIGNSSLSGARLGSLSIDILGEARKVAQTMTNIELSENNDFNHNYIAALFLPHTDLGIFPSVQKRLSFS